MIESATERAAAERRAAAPKRIAAVLPNWIGDAVMATPALRALKRHFRGAELVGIARPPICELLRGVPSLDALWMLPNETVSSVGRVRSLARLLRNGQFDVLVHFTNSLATAAAAALARVPERVGYARRGRAMLLTRRLEPPRDAGRLSPVPAIDYYLALAEALGCPSQPPRLELATNAADEAAAGRLWSSFGPRAYRPTVAINNSGSFGEAKLWPEAAVARLARRIVEELDYNALILAGPAEAQAAGRILVLAASAAVFTTAGAPSLGLSKAAVRRSRLMVSTDSGPRHFAAAFGIPLVTLFGPTDPRWTDLHTERDRWVGLALPCQPCQKRVCPLGHHRCMRNLEVETVWRALHEQLEKFPG